MNLNKNLLLVYILQQTDASPTFRLSKTSFLVFNVFFQLFPSKRRKKRKSAKILVISWGKHSCSFFHKIFNFIVTLYGHMPFLIFFLVFELFWTYKWPLSSLFYRTKKCRSKEKRGGALSIRLKKSFGRTKKPLKRGYILWD